ncbi:MAG: RIP metalloprotease RseP [Burkholderiaceae bacterium]
MVTIIAFLVALTVLIFVHELGHYLAARFYDVKVLRFSIGFGKPLLSWSVGRDRTQWTLAMIPLGGYVRMVDERDDSQGPIAAADLPRAFTRQSLGARSVIVAAGPVANFLLAIVLYACVGWIGVMEPVATIAPPAGGTPAAQAGFAAGDTIETIDGATIRSWHDVRMKLLEPVIERRTVPVAVVRDGAQRELELSTASLPEGEAERDFMRSLGLAVAPGEVIIGDLLDDGAARRAGLATGDRVLAIEGGAIIRARDLIDIVRASPGRSLQFDLLRDGTELTVEVVPEAIREDGEGAPTIGRIGASLRDQLDMALVRHGPLEALWIGARQTWDMSLFSLRMFGKMISGELSIRNLSGPVTIADLAGKTAKVGWFAYLSFLALISISLGVLNLLPIPVLDGGHLVYYALEAVRGRPLSERMMDLTQRAGVGVILVMMVVALFNDIARQFGL